jgi:hypothetical protein
VNALIIANTQIRRDPTGRYCLNDLHQASGGAKRHQPANWLRLDQTAELIAEIENTEKSAGGLLTSEEAPLSTVNDGFGNGTYAVKELVYAYAMWISAKFHLHVIRAYDALVTGAASTPQPIPAPPNHRADVLVSAGRIFAAALRTAQKTRMAPARAMRAAFACAQRHTGVDWTDELGVEVAADPAGADAALAYDDSIAWFYTALTAGDIPGVSARPALSTSVYDLYQRWCSANGARIAAQQHFINALQRRYGVASARKRYQAGSQVLGPHGVLYLGDIIPPVDRTETDWLGEQISVFHAAVQTYREANG